MTEEQYEILDAYVKVVQIALGLSHWTIKVSRKPCGKNYGGQNSCTPHRNHASILFSKHFDELDEVEQRKVVVHELLHCHTESLMMSVHTFVNSGLIMPLFASPSYKLIDEHHERMVDALSATYCDHVPMIPWDGDAVT